MAGLLFAKSKKVDLYLLKGGFQPPAKRGKEVSYRPGYTVWVPILPHRTYRVDFKIVFGELWGVLNLLGGSGTL